MADINTELKNIQNSIYGKDVRQSIYDGIDAINEETENTTTRQKNLENTFNAEIANKTLSDPSNEEIVAARTDNINNKTYDTLGKRLDENSEQLADVMTKQGDITLLNTADKSSVVNAIKEVKNQANINQTGVNSINNQVSSINSNVFTLQTQVTNLASGSPRGTYTTLADLQAAYPTGTSGIFVVIADGKWYYWNSSAWTAGGQYQSTDLPDGIDTELLKQKYATCLTDNFFSIDTVNKKLSMNFSNGGEGLITYNNQSIFIHQQDDIIWTETSWDYVKTCYYDLSDKKIHMAQTYQAISDKYLILFYLRYDRVWLNERSIIVNGIPVVSQVKSSSLGIITAQNVFDVDTVRKIIKVNGGDFYWNKKYYTISPQEDINYTEPSWDYVKACYYDILDEKIHYITYPTEAPVTGIVLFYIRYNTIFGNEKAVNINGIPAWDMKKHYKWTDNRFVFPDELYLVKDIDYSIHSENFNFISSINDNLLFELNSLTFSEQFKHSGKIKFNELGSFDSQLVGIKEDDTQNALVKSVKINITDKVKTNTIPKILVMGDSITNRNIPYLVKWWLQQWGINPSMIGTMQNSDGNFPITLGEGREGWRWTDYTYTTAAGTGTGKPNISSDKNNVHSNPFINPTTSKYDFSYYMSQQGFTGVDFITVMLGTNDINNYTIFGGATNLTINKIIQNMKDSFNIIEASIHSYNPNIKIGLIPPIMPGINYSNFSNQMQFIEEEIAAFKSKTNVYILGNYLATGRMSGKLDTELGTAVSDINNTRKIALSSNVHDNPNNEYINALWSASWIMNMLN